MKISHFLNAWSTETYEMYLQNSSKWRDLGFPIPKGPAWMFNPPALASDVIACEERLGTRIPEDLKDFYLATNGWPFTYARSSPGNFLPVQEIAPLRQVSPKTYQVFFETLQLINREHTAGGYICLTHNSMGSEMILGACDFNHYLMDPFLGDLDPRNAFNDVLVECRALYNQGLRDAFR